VKERYSLNQSISYCVVYSSVEYPHRPLPRALRGNGSPAPEAFTLRRLGAWIAEGARATAVVDSAVAPEEEKEGAPVVEFVFAIPRKGTNRSSASAEPSAWPKDTSKLALAAASLACSPTVSERRSAPRSRAGGDCRHRASISTECAVRRSADAGSATRSGIRIVGDRSHFAPCAPATAPALAPVPSTSPPRGG